MSEIHETVDTGQLSIGSSSRDGVRILVLRGEIDRDVQQRLTEALLAPDDSGSMPSTVLDFRGVTFMDSSGINVLVTAHHASRDAGVWLRLAGVQESVRRVIELVCLDTVISSYPDVDQALAG